MVRIRVVYPESRIRIFPSWVRGQKRMVPTDEEFKENFSKLSEIWSGILIPDLEFFHPGYRGQKSTAFKTLFYIFSASTFKTSKYYK